MNKFIYGLIGLLLVTGSAYGKGKLQNEDFKTLTEITNAGGSASQLLNDTKIYVTANSINQQLSTAIQSGLIGGGGGSSLGVQLLQNPGFEVGVSTGWSNSGGTFTAISAGSNLLIGQGSATFQATGSGQYMQSSLYAIPNGLKGRSCTAQILFKGGDANLTLQVTDGTNVLTSADLFPAAGPTTLATPSFICPSSGSLRLKLISTASSALVALDQMFLGENVLTQVSQASLYGGATISGCSGAWTTTAGTASAFSPQTGCTYSTFGAASAPPSNVPALTFASLPPGEYMVFFDGTFSSSTGGAAVTGDLTDGTNLIARNSEALLGGSSSILVPNLTFSVPVTAGQSNVTWELFGSSGGGSTFTANVTSIRVYRFPTQTELAVRPETINWRVAAYNLSPGGPLYYSTANTDLKQTGMSLVQKSGSLPVLQTCTGGEASSGSTCSNDGDLGLSFNLPAAGTVRACVEFSSGLNSSGTVDGIFNIVETPDDDETTLLQISSGNAIDFLASSTGQHEKLFHLCEDMPFASAGKKTLRLITSGATSTSGTSNYVAAGVTNVLAYWTITPITQNIPAPVFVGSVTSPSSGAIVSAAAVVNNTGSACPVLQQEGNWIDNTIWNVTGDCTANFTPGIFSGTPICMVGGYNTVQPNVDCQIIGLNDTAVRFKCYIGDTGAAFDSGVSLICRGAK